MGASDFVIRSKGKTAKGAFSAAVKEAKYLYGNAGYTGSIAEKDSYIEVPLPKGVELNEFLDKMLDDPRFDDKWGPAGCVKLDKETFLFFGWASC